MSCLKKFYEKVGLMNISKYDRYGIFFNLFCILLNIFLFLLLFMSKKNVTLRFSYRANKANAVEVRSPEWKNLKLDCKQGGDKYKLFTKKIDVKFNNNSPKNVSFQYYVDGKPLGKNDKWISVKPSFKNPIIICNYEKLHSKKVTLRFTIDYKTNYGENLKITGSIPELGFWNSKYGYQMTYVDNNDNYNWQAEIELDGLPEILMYRYYVVYADGNKRFESGSVRTIRLSESILNDQSKIIELNDIWRNKSIFIKNKDDSNLMGQLMTQNFKAHSKIAKLIFFCQYDIRKDYELRHLSKNNYGISAVGSINELGEWKAENSIFLTQCNSDLWIGSVNIDISHIQNINFEYKLLLNIFDKKDKRKVYEYFWQSGENNTYSSQLLTDSKRLIFVIEIGRPCFSIDTLAKVSDIPFYHNFQIMAKETVQIIHSGKYTPKNSASSIDIKKQINDMIHNTETIKPDVQFEFNESIISHKRSDFCQVEVVDDTSFNAAKIIQDRLNIEKVCVLNFASATQPGGGFLHGRQAQEESLSRSSALYGSLKPQTEMYVYHKRHRDPLYTDYMIYSPNVPVIRNDDGELIPPFYVSVITSAAVNFNQIIQSYYEKKKFHDNDDYYTTLNLNDNSTVNNNDSDDDDDENDDNILNDQYLIDMQVETRNVMFKRCQKILQLAICKGDRAIVLGAFGCGVFKNDPGMISLIFKELLFEGRYEYAKFFDYVAFAIKKGKKDSTNFDVFEKNLKRSNSEL